MARQRTFLRGIGKTPSFNRISLLFVAMIGSYEPGSLAVAQAAEHDAPLTEEEAVRRALERSDLRTAIDGSVDVARAESIRASLWENPEVWYTREQTYGALSTGEDYLWATQKIDPSGSVGLRSKASEQRANAVRERGRAREARVAAQVRLRFHEVLRLQGQVAVAQHLVDRLEIAVDTVRKREAAGDASIYDRRRLERELANTRARTVTLEAARARAWEVLAALVEDHRDTSAPWPRASGTLLPEALPSQDTFAQRLDTRPDLQAFERIAAAAEMEEHAASRGWVPELTLGGGWKSIDFGDRIHGFMGIVALTLPFLDHGQNRALAAQGARRSAQGEHEWALALAKGDMRGLWIEAARLWETARSYREERSELSEALVRTAEAGYRGGELGVLELVDAYRGMQEDEARALDLEFQARRARIELELSTGGYTP
jgi:cobalt-zinc-cadmium efflux system outer membrane protein